MSTNNNLLEHGKHNLTEALNVNSYFFLFPIFMLCLTTTITKLGKKNRIKKYTIKIK